MATQRLRVGADLLLRVLNPLPYVAVNAGMPLHAKVVAIVGSNLVNIVYWDAKGSQHALESVQVRFSGQPNPGGDYFAEFDDASANETQANPNDSGGPTTGGMVKRDPSLDSTTGQRPPEPAPAPAPKPAAKKAPAKKVAAKAPAKKAAAKAPAKKRR